jgi:2-keto-4-pentenoate hydratase
MHADSGAIGDGHAGPGDAPVRAETLAEVADLLLAAYDSRIPVEPLTSKFEGLTLADAYEIQLLQIRRREAGGARIKGHKVGLSSPAMQRQMGVSQPDYGHLLDDMFWLENQPVPTGQFLQPRVEPEIAFVLKRQLAGPGVTVADAAAAVDFVLPALELIDSRIRDWRIGIIDTIADNASSGGVVLGSKPTRLTDVDLRLSGCTLHRNGVLVGTGAGGAALGSPLASLTWLANTVGARGVVLEPGHVVLPGSITASVQVGAGDAVTAAFGGLGSVSARFTEEIP